jgi:hypothetical protein
MYRQFLSFTSSPLYLCEKKPVPNVLQVAYVTEPFCRLRREREKNALISAETEKNKSFDQLYTESLYRFRYPSSPQNGGINPWLAALSGAARE